MRQKSKHLLDFLDGRGKAAIDALRSSMAEAAESLQFERAAALRDRVRSAEQIVEKQRITSVGRGDLDAIAFAAEGDDRRTGTRCGHECRGKLGHARAARCGGYPGGTPARGRCR